jgi:hypothetical protein
VRHDSADREVDPPDQARCRPRSVPADVRGIAPHDHGDVLVLKRLHQRSDERPTTRVGDASSCSHDLQTIIADGHDEA